MWMKNIFEFVNNCVFFFLLETFQMDCIRNERFKCHSSETFISVPNSLQMLQQNNHNSLMYFEPFLDGSTHKQ